MRIQYDMDAVATTAPKRRTSWAVRLSKVDGRSSLGKLMRQVRADLIRHVGGRPSATQKMMIERAVMLTGYLARLDAEALSPVGLSDHRRREYLAADGSLRRTLREIGLEGATDEREATLADALVSAPAGPPARSAMPSSDALAPAVPE